VVRYGSPGGSLRSAGGFGTKIFTIILSGIEGMNSTGSGHGPVASCCECGDEPSGLCATELVTKGMKNTPMYIC
jgi:hypothetical protein